VFNYNFLVGFEGQQQVFSDISQAVELEWSANTGPHTVHNSVDNHPKISLTCMSTYVLVLALIPIANSTTLLILTP
jgi:hypothetical protein